MKILNRKLSPQDFMRYIHEMKTPFRKIDSLVFHHTSSPVETWQGSKSMLHYYNIYQSRGWRSGPHIFIAPDGIWLFTPIKKRGTHATKEAARHSIGIEIVGRYNEGPPTDETMCKYIALVAETLWMKFNIDPKNMKCHWDFDKFTFCSPHVNGDWIRMNRALHTDYIRSIYINTLKGIRG